MQEEQEQAADQHAEAQAAAPDEAASTEQQPEPQPAASTEQQPEPQPAAPDENDFHDEVSYQAVEKEGTVTAIWEMQGQKHLRTIDPRSNEGKQILQLFETAG